MSPYRTISPDKPYYIRQVRFLTIYDRKRRKNGYD